MDDQYQPLIDSMEREGDGALLDFIYKNRETIKALIDGEIDAQTAEESMTSKENPHG